MLSKSFIHIEGIGPARESAIWKSGVTSWEAILASGPSACFPKSGQAQLRGQIQDSAVALERLDGAFFEERMPTAEMWRLYPEFKPKTVFLDIETTGLYSGSDDITIISLFDGQQARALVRGQDLDEFPAIIAQYALLVTYNGKCFDLPFLHAHFPQFQRHYAHIDLRYPLHNLGLSGGLKGVERKVGILRPGALSQVDGFMAVLLWREYQKGNQKALDTLVRYGLEDVLNLKPLLELVYNRHIRRLPISIPAIQPEALPQINIPYDSQLIQRLAQVWGA